MNIDQFNGFLMSRDSILAEIQNGNISKIHNSTLLPIYIARTHELRHWLETRAIDAQRRNARLLKKVLCLIDRDDISTVLAMHAATITDTYWVKPIDSPLTWNDVRYNENYFCNLALRGDLSAFSQPPSRTPELTNIGSFEKCWKLEDGKWWLYKRANTKELFSELFIYHLGIELGFPTAYYEPCDGDIRSLDFTDAAHVNFEPAYSWMSDNEDYVANYRYLENINSSLADQYLELLLLDSYCLNVDRHTFNYGVLRDVDTGAILRMAPNFDNNIALLSNGYLSGPRRPDMLGQDLHKLEDETNAISKYATRHPLPVVTSEMIDRCIDAVNMPADREYIHHFIMVGYEQTPVPQIAARQQVLSIDEVISQAAARKKEDISDHITQDTSYTL